MTLLRITLPHFGRALSCLFCGLSGLYCQVLTPFPIDGAIQTSDRRPLADAKVSFQRLATPQVIPNPIGGYRILPPSPSSLFAGTAVTGSDGRFRIAGAKSGEYAFCVDAPPFLDPCKWKYRPTFNVKSDAEAVVPPVLLEEGAILTIAVTDPSGHLSALEKAAGSARLIVGVVTKSGAIHVADKEVPTNNTTARYRITIPKEEDLNLWVFTRHLTLANSSGSIVEGKGESEALRVRASDSGLTVALTVLGTRDPLSGLLAK